MKCLVPFMPNSAFNGMVKTFHTFLVYGLGEVLARLITFLGFFVLARTLSKEDYGLLESYVVTIGVIGVIGAAGMNNALQAFYYSKDEYVDVSLSQRISTAFYTLLIWQCGLVVLCGVIGVLGNFTQSIELAVLLPLIAALTVQLQLMQDVFRLRFEPGKYMLSTLLSKGGAAIVSVIAVLMGGGVAGYFSGYFFALLASFLLMFYVMRDDLQCAMHLGYARGLLQYGVPFIFVGIGAWAFTSLDRWLLAGLSGLSAVADYAFAVRISFLVSFVSFAFGQAWAPMVFKLKESRPADYLSIYADAFLSFTLVISIFATAVSIFSPELQAVMFHDKYKEALPAILLLCFASVIQATTHFTAIGISLSRKTRYFAAFSWIAACISLLGNSILIPYWGIYAAALMNFFSSALLSLLYFAISQKEYHMRFVARDVRWLALLVGYLFIGSAFFVLTGGPFESLSLKISFLVLALIGGVFFLKMMVFRYVR